MVDEIKAGKVLWYPCQGTDKSLERKKKKKKRNKNRRMKNSLLIYKQAGKERIERKTALSSL